LWVVQSYPLCESLLCDLFPLSSSRKVIRLRISSNRTCGPLEQSLFFFSVCTVKSVLFFPGNTAPQWGVLSIVSTCDV
jgi:hypothetical protein